MNAARILVGLAIMLLVPACGNSEKPVEHHDGTLTWGVLSTFPPRTLKAVGEVDYCVGDPRPSIKRPHIRYRGNSVYIRLKAHIPQSKTRLCAGVGLFIKRKITLRRNLADVKIYDSGYSPPQLVWPE